MSIYGNFTPTPTMFSESISDVNSCLATLTTLLVTNPANSEKWVEAPAHTFTAPIDGAGRFITLIFAATSSTQLTLTVKDQNGAGICTRSIVISGTQTVRYFTCSRFAYIQTEPDFQFLDGGMLTAFPEAEGGNANYAFGSGTNNSGGSFDGANIYMTQYFMLDNGSPGSASRLIRKDVSVDSTPVQMQMGTGAFKYDAVELRATYGSVNRVAGRFYNAYLCDSSLAPGVVRTLPIGNSGETGSFRVLGSAPQPGTTMRLMLRIA